MSFALLEDISSPPERDDENVMHPHRRRLERPAPVRRAGAAPARPQRCTSPVRREQRKQRVYDHAA